MLIFTPGFSKEKINLIWQEMNVGNWSSDWIPELLSEFDITEYTDGKYEIFLDKSIIVVCEYRGDYFEKLRKRNCKFGVFHLDDELLCHPSHFYQDANFVYRYYWTKRYTDQENISFFPPGYKAGFWKNSQNIQIKEAKDRQYIWSFAGQILYHATRQYMINAMKEFEPYFFHEIHVWNDKKSLSPQEYRDMLLESVFVPCGRGYWNLDSYRVYEALECGCIPIVEKSPLDLFRYQFGDHPFLAVENWSEAPALMSELLSDPVRLEERRKCCHQWWLNYKKELKAKITNDILKLL
jgi:hypothetical protein